MWFIGVEVDKRRVHPLLKKILDPPLYRVEDIKKLDYIQNIQAIIYFKNINS